MLTSNLPPTLFMVFRTGLHYNEEVRQSTNLREQSNTIGYQMGSLPATGLWFTLWPRFLEWRISSMNEKITWLRTWQHFWLGGGGTSVEVKFRGQT